MNEDNIKRAISNSSESLLSLSEAVKSFKFPKAVELEFETLELNEKYIKDLLNSVPAGYAKALAETDFIYIFEIENSNDSIQAEIFEHLASARQDQHIKDEKKDYCRVNHANSQHLYVGRSKKLRSRLSQHLGSENGGLFAMHLSRWSTQINAKIKVSYYQLDNEDNLLVQALEDGLWDELKPMFGRKGDK
ncbi:GIY-YIG nuclease family protein [Vibrio parahaemolyticus]|nr:GIY-YIG nuclease family protein [Vibrio parahaemolyticus]EKG2657519.1 GIY-YIG nuclease family protein [Vibrio parahaemolyticus]